MKKIQLLITFIALSAVAFSCGQQGKTATSFTTDIYCDHCETCEYCKARVETALLSTDGVNSADMQVGEKAIFVTYDAAKIDEQQIKMAIAKTGYRAGDVPADPAAYDSLDDCCKRK